MAAYQSRSVWSAGQMSEDGAKTNKYQSPTLADESFHAHTSPLTPKLIGCRTAPAHGGGQALSNIGPSNMASWMCLPPSHGVRASQA